MTILRTEQATLQYAHKVIAKNLNIQFERPEVVSIIGPNGSGKSTLLKALARLLVPAGGAIYLNGQDLQQLDRNTLAKTISIMPQQVQAPGDMTVRDLVTYGRLPYQHLFAGLSEQDEQAIETALTATEMKELQNQRLSSLSGGEQQRAWLAMAIAKEPQVLLLDEPTTYLDIRHQLELMELVVHLYKTRHILVVMVLHDLNHAARYSQRLIAVKDGSVFADGPVAEVFCPAVLEPLYGIRAVVTEVQEGDERYLACFPYAAVST